MWQRCLVGMALVALLALCVPSPAQPATKGKKYALVIGISEYKHANLPPLKFPENDVEELAEVLSGKLAGFHDVQVMTVSRGTGTAKGKKKEKKLARDLPTKAAIEKAVDTLLSKKTKDDTVLIALAGHGVQLEVPDPEEKKPSNTYRYFCPVDADFAKISHATGRAPGLVNLDDLLKRLGDCEAGTRLILIDACRNEAKAESSTRNVDLQKITIPVGVGALYSCKSGERAWETSKLGKSGHGVFFHFVIEGLKGDAANEKGEVRWSRLAEFATEQVSDEVPRIIGGGARQTPHAASNLVGASPILTSGAPRKVKPPPVVVISEAEKAYRRGRDLLRGTRDVKIDRVKAVAEFEKAAKAKHPLAMVALTRCFRGTEQMIAKDDRPAAEAALGAGLEDRARDNDPDALVELGHLLRSSPPKSGKKRAYETFKKAADLGSVEGIYLVGISHGQGLGVGVEKDPDKELRFIEDAARKGLAAAQHALARIFDGHRPHLNVPKNEKEAIRWFTAAAEQHHPDSLADLGWKYLHGPGVPIDHIKAVGLFRQAAAQRHHWAPHTLGDIFRNGTDQGIKKDEKAAVKYFQQAAQQGVKGAYLDLGRMLATSAAVKNEKEAIVWLEKACINLSGDQAKEAKQLLDKLKK